ncbi:MAG: inositol-3-phosphate synthase [bacterium]
MQKQEYIEAKYNERYTLIGEDGKPQNLIAEHLLRTNTVVPKLGFMMVGLGGNNGTTVTSGVLANKKNLKWETKRGEAHANYYGSFTQCVTTKVGMKVKKAQDGTMILEDVYLPIKDLLPIVNPNDLVIGGWDINGIDMYNATIRAKVLEPTLIHQLKEELSQIKPLSGVFNIEYVASNQEDRADNVKKGTTKELIAQLQEDIKTFKTKNGLTKIVVLWTANTEKYFPKDIETIEELDRLIDTNASLPPSVLYAVATLKEKCIFLNGSPQNTVHPALIKLAAREGMQIAGADFKSGQTKYKTAMGDFLVGSGMRLASVISYNHLGNNDGKNLSEPHTFRSKEKSKGSVLDDCLKSNKVLYPAGKDKIDHTVVIKYCPFVGDSKRAMDEYNSEIFLEGCNTIVSYNICEDSLLAAPIMIDLCIMAELLSRITIDTKPIGPVLSYLSYFFKAPVTNHHEYVINSLSKQKEILTSLMKACAGYVPDDSTLLSFNY